MDDKSLQLLVDLHVNNKRQGPGNDATFKKALELAGFDKNSILSIADIGCGTGVSTLALAKNTNAHITAVDLFPNFLAKLNANASEANLSSRITTQKADMAKLPFQKEQFDVIWAEGAIYNIGFEKGIRLWKEFLKPGGVMVLTEITWLTHDVPNELSVHWQEEYPEIAHASTKIRQLEENGYTVKAYFPLTDEAWLDGYYGPLQASFKSFLQRNNNSVAAKEIIKAEEAEIELYKKYKKYVSYGCYIAQKP